MVAFKHPANLAVVLCLLMPWASFADEPLVLPGDRPWAQGVTEERQQAARDLFTEGNNLLDGAAFVLAIEKYREALNHWDHPAIHYNLAFALLNLDKPIEVHQHLLAALRYGAEPLDSEKFETARTYKSFVEKQLARVELRCDTPGAAVSMDGQPLFTAPGHYEGFVRPGPHSFLTTKAGYAPAPLVRTLSPGEHSVIPLKVYSAEDLTRYRRRWPAWKPWTVMGAGLAVALGGGAFYMRASESYRDFDAQVTACGGCMASPQLTGLRDRGDTLQRAAFSLYAVGGGAIVTGAVLAYLNRPQPYRIDPSALEDGQQFSVAPLVGQDEAGVLTTFRF